MMIASAAGSRNLLAPWTAPTPLSIPFVGDQGQSAYGGDYMSTFAVPRGVTAPGATIMSVWSQVDPTFGNAVDRLITSDIVVAP